MISTCTRVAIAEDNDEFRLTIRDILSFEPDLNVVALWRNGREVIDEIEEVKPDVLLLDVNMPVLDGVDTVRALKGRALQTKVVMLTMHDSANTVIDSIKHGARGYLVKDGTSDEIIRAVREVAQGNALIHPKVMPILLNEMQKENHLSESWRDVLTLREYEVLIEMATGKTNESIAETLHITPKTTKNHVSHILAKLDVTDRAQAVLHAAKEKWIEL